MRAAYAVEYNVDAITRQAVDLLDEVLMLVVDRDAAELGDGRCPA